MKKSKTLGLAVLVLFLTTGGYSQNATQSIDLSTVQNDQAWYSYNLEATYNEEEQFVQVQGGDGHAILWLNDFSFENGTIEADIRGKNIPGKSFVGIAFHGVDQQQYDAVYFRPFNFAGSRQQFSVQYISYPDKNWSYLRENFPGKYESRLTSVPDPVDTWFHVTIEVNHPSVKVYVNNDAKPSLEFEQLRSERKVGFIGLWVDNGSTGDFKNIVVKSK